MTHASGVPRPGGGAEADGDFRIASADSASVTSRDCETGNITLVTVRRCLLTYLRSPKCARQKLSSASGSVLAKAELMNMPRYWPCLSM